MSQAASPSAPVAREDLADAVTAAQHELAEGVRRGDLTRDPYRFVLGALSVTVGLFPGLVARMEDAAQAARVPLSAEERSAFRSEVREGLRQEAGKLSRAANRRTAMLAGAVVVGVALAAGLGGYAAGRAAGREDMAALGSRFAVDTPSARAWLDLLRANPDPRPALAAGTAWQDPATSRRAVEFRLWTDPPPATAPPRR